MVGKRIRLPENISCKRPRYLVNWELLKYARNVREPSDTRLGSNGSCAVSLYHLGVFRDHDVDQISTRLNMNIDHACVKLQRRYPDISMTRSRVGIEDHMWRHNVVKEALVGTGYNLSRVWLHSGIDYTNRLFLVDGYLNPQFTDIETKDVHLQSNHHVDMNDDSWKHTIAIKDGRIWCPGVSESGIPVSNLWINEKGFVDAENGYMRKILRVYELQ